MSSLRYQSIDMLRGCAISLMILYHVCYDLTYFQILHFDFYHDPFWLGARILIVSMFLLLVGISLELSARRGLRNPVFVRAFIRRLLGLLLCALLVSLSSYWLSPARWIYFGILHFIALASLLGLFFVGQPGLRLWLPGLTVIGLGVFGAYPLFDAPYLQWLGMMTYKPQTDDYVPLFPWFGVVLLGLYLGGRCFGDSVPGFIARPYPGRVPGLLSWAGRHSLLIYMLHQPIVFGILMVVTGRTV